MNVFSAGNDTFHDVVNMIHDVIRTAYHFHTLLNSCLSVLEIIKLNKSDVER